MPDDGRGRRRPALVAVGVVRRTGHSAAITLPRELEPLGFTLGVRVVMILEGRLLRVVSEERAALLLAGPAQLWGEQVI